MKIEGKKRVVVWGKEKDAREELNVVLVGSIPSDTSSVASPGMCVVCENAWQMRWAWAESSAYFEK